MDLIKIYSCGPTVYDYAHIGNWRTFVLTDLLRRQLEYTGQSVKHVMNITDVDDKTITASQKQNISLGELTKKYEEIFLTDLKSLNILPPTKLTRATEYIPEMIALISKLIEKGNAYKTSDGVYFSVASFPRYGQLSKRPIDQLANTEDGSDPPANAGRAGKKDSRDFALWKFETPTDNGNAWEAPFGPPGSRAGKGRPGWHIECSAMSMKELGEQFDIHTGGQDLIFPHHENEVAQSEAATGKTPFVKRWFHVAFVNVDGQKMSKSLQNIYTLKDLAEHCITPLAYRYWVLTAHYRSPVNFTWEAVGGAQTALKKLHDTFQLWVSETHEIGEVDQAYKQKFLDAINDDLNLPQALALVWELLNVKSPALNIGDLRATLLDFDKVFGLGLADIKPLVIPPEVTALVAQREAARQAQDWPLADQLRQQIEKLGYQVKDTEKGSEIGKS